MVKAVVRASAIDPSESQADVVLSVQGVSKKFCRNLKRSLFYGVRDIASEIVGAKERSQHLRPKEFWALKDVSFQLRRGEALGLIGKNGSGKSTLLRIIAGLIRPDAGTVEVNGRVAPLIALGAGFNPILTGRENIYANMSILGLSKREIDKRFDEVLDFAEIGEAIDSPVQSYSSGMAARLGFASAIHTEPDILLVDEVLAVGDIRFRSKCRRQLHKLRQNGTSFILVSHHAQMILETCHQAIYLLNGRSIATGDTPTVMNQYEEDIFAVGGKKTPGKLILPHKAPSESTGLDILSVFLRNSQFAPVLSPQTGEPTYFCVACKASKEIENFGLLVSIHELSGEGEPVLVLSSFNDRITFNIKPGLHEIRIAMPHLGLKTGNYTATIYARKDGIYTFDSVESFMFTVRAKEGMSRCLFYQPRTWEIASS
ncbi:MAG: ATP-binding cassette domain-containing protein [Cyanosarcina radialis HA8281-LM2]|jgi:lipopolysaccharide transport system ATP-binding protein|nr:ATP-binding cassette domain-containing protein [Cyanosarcina radialis HA8281-LM2]